MYYAPWCGHSKKAKPEMDKFISGHDGTNEKGVNVSATIVNSDDNKDEVKKQGVSGFPTFKAHLIKDGKEVTNYVINLPSRTYDALKSAMNDAVEKVKQF